MKYCIYSNALFEDTDMNIEHIIPISLGGSDEFITMVNKETNSKLGSSIDGKFINDFLVKMKQINMNSIGHSKKEPYLKIKSSSIDGRPVNVTFTNKNIEVYDPIKNKVLVGKNQISMKTSIDIYSRFKFVCKVALSGGYFLFGDKFVDYADHDTLRKAIFCEDLKNEKLDLRFYDNLHPIEEKDKNDIEMIKFLFNYLGGSVVLFSYSPSSIIVHVGIGGDFVGMVNFDAEIRFFPNNDEFRLGRVLLCKDGKLYQKSFWKTIYDMNKDLDLVHIDDSKLDI